MKNIKFRLIVMSFLEIGIWGAYLTSMGRYLGPNGMGDKIGVFYSIQGIVSIFMPALLGMVADRWIQAQKMLGLSHLISGVAMIAAGLYGITAGADVQFPVLFSLYTIGVAFYMPTLALSNSVAYNALENGGYDTVKEFPPIRVFGTIGFICLMWIVDLCGWQASSLQFVVSGGMSLVLALYALTLPACPIVGAIEKKSFFEAMGLKAFSLFKDSRMAVFFLFSMFLGVSLQITNGFANPFISSFGAQSQYAGTFGVNHANMLVSLSQISETLCILLIPFCMKKFGIKKVMLIAMFAWVLRFGLFAVGDPGPGVWLFILSMIVYGVAFDFFNISGSLFVDKETSPEIRSSAQGLFMLMTNGLGATIGTLAAQKVVNVFCAWKPFTVNGGEQMFLVGNWVSVWGIFAAYALLVAVAFIFAFKYKE